MDAAVIDDAEAAAALMSMTNIYYRFRHLVGKPGYSEKPARLRMNRLAKPTANKTDLELFCLAVSAINGCEVCLRAHEKAVLEGGLSEDQVHDAVRIAAMVHAAAVALEIPIATSKVGARWPEDHHRDQGGLSPFARYRATFRGVVPNKEVSVETPFRRIRRIRRIALPILLRSIAAVVLVALFSVSTVGCFGRFALTRRIYDWNEHVSGEKWVRSLVFVLVVPIYGVVNLFDAFFANVVEFWSEHNPMASVPGTERWTYGPGGEAVRMTLREDGAIDVLVTAPGCPAKRFSLVREVNGVALLDTSGVEIARAGDGPDGEPALLGSGRH